MKCHKMKHRKRWSWPFWSRTRGTVSQFVLQATGVKTAHQT